jgi:hypothetical protein
VPSAQEAKRSASRFFVASWPWLHPNYLLIIIHVRKFQNKNYIFEQNVGKRKSKSTNYYTT